MDSRRGCMGTIAETQPTFATEGRIDEVDDSLVQWIRKLEARLAEQTVEIARLSRLKQFLSPQLANLILSKEPEDALRSHRREIVVVFVDLRGFTRFAETSAPEDVAAVLGEYHKQVGNAALAHEGTLERFTGDGVMIFFDDPVPIADAAWRATQMSLLLQTRLRALCVEWARRGHAVDFGIGIAQGYATIGVIGCASRRDYAAIGPVTNLANRLCGAACAGQVYVSQRIANAIEPFVELEELPKLRLKGFLNRQIAYSVRRGVATT